MKYSTPELVAIGRAAALVQGGEEGFLDNDASMTSKPIAGVALGLDE